MTTKNLLTGFTDVTLEICGKKCNFKHGIKNKDKKELAKKIGIDKLQESFNESVQLQADVEYITEKIDLLKEQRALYKDMNKPPKKQLGIVEELLSLQDQLHEKTEEMKKLSIEYGTGIDEKMADSWGETAEFYLTNITKDEFINNATPTDSAIARQLDRIHTLCMMGEDKEEIKKEIEENINSFLRDQGYSISNRYEIDSI